MSPGFVTGPAWIASGAALSASFTWSVSSLLFARASRTLGALRVNLYRLLLATAFVLVAHRIFEGSFVPLHLERSSILFLASSGVVGLALGDLFYFHSIAVLGPRKGSLLMATAPIQAGLLAGLFLGERLGLVAWLGIAANFVGVFLVLMDRRTTGAWDAEIRPAARRVAVAAGLLGGFGQAMGLVLAKRGMVLAGSELATPLNAHVIRMLAGLAVVLLWTMLHRRPRTIDPRAKKSALLSLGVAAFLGPSLGVWLSLVALQGKTTGVAAALLSLAPVMVIPLVHIFHGEKVGRLGILGALMATAGTILLI